MAYADPPYPGNAGLYRDHPDFGGEVDHEQLVDRLVSDFDAWALSTSAEALPAVLRWCPPGVRVAAWHRGARSHARAQLPVNAWEPVIYGGRVVHLVGETRPRVDSLVHVARPRTTDPHRVIGAKSATFCRWLFDLLDARPCDTFTDLFPGSGGVARAWDLFAGQHDASPSTSPTRRPGPLDA